MAIGFGSGLSPVAPGTVGSVVALLPGWFLIQSDAASFCVFILIASLLGVWWCQQAGQRLGVSDHGAIVFDEFVGQWIALGLPWYLLQGGLPVPVIILGGLLAFRLFDIAKPWPVGWLDRHLKGGWGVMLDDVAAGLMAGALLTAVGIPLVVLSH